MRLQRGGFMTIADLTPLKNNDIEYEQLAANVSERYKCDWDDAVHDSYGVFVKQSNERRESIREIRLKAETLVKEVEGFDIDELARKGMILCREAERI